MTYIALLLIPIFASPALQPKTTQSSNTTQTKKSENVVKRGAQLSSGNFVDLDEVAANPEKFMGKTALISGTASAVCKKKGCWMTIKGNNPATKARVTFKNYSFFVPVDSKDMKARVEGLVEIKFMSEGERQHLADDEKVDVSKIPKVEMRIIATGVELRR